MNIRNARPLDLDTANHIIEAAIMTWDLPERVKRLTLPSYKYTDHDLDHMTIVVAEGDEQIVGVAAWEEINSDLLLHGIYVDPQHHRRGIGTALFQAVETAAQNMQLQGIVVKAQKGSEPFYQSLGMHKMDVTDQRQDFENRYYKTLA
jgi:N-acetylglutamate synthase-like GNAT family acetyltransferase